MIMIYRSTDSMIDLKMRVHRKFNSLGQITGIPSDWGNDKYYGSMIIYGNATKRRWKLILLFKTKNLVGDSDMNAPAVAVFFLSGSRYPRARSTHWAGGWAGCAPETYEWFRQLGSSSQIGWNSKTINQYIYILINLILSIPWICHFCCWTRHWHQAVCVGDRASRGGRWSQKYLRAESQGRPAKAMRWTDHFPTGNGTIYQFNFKDWGCTIASNVRPSVLGTP
jgi:hypothetical protein